MQKLLKIAGVGLGIMLMTTSGVGAQPAGQQALVLQGGTLIDGTGKAPVQNAVVVVQGSRITAVGVKGQVRIPVGAKVVDATGKTILPGFIDTHTHTQEWHYPMFVHYGVTTIQDKNNDPPWMLAQREALAKGWMNGPRLYTSGATIRGTWGNNNFNTPDTVGYEGTKAYAQAWRAAGFDSFNTNQWIDDDQRRALIEVADAAHIPVMGHVRNMRTAATLGYKYAEHMFGIGAAVIDPEDKTSIGEEGTPTEYLMDPTKFQPLIDHMVKLDVTVNPTLVASWIAATPRGAEMQRELAQLARDPNLAFVPQDVRNQWIEGRSRNPMGYDKVAIFLKQYVDSGGQVSVGTDSGGGVVPGISLHYEMQMYVDLGLTPMQAIQAATSWNAHLIRHDKDIGSVEVGKFGDFTIITGDPLQDIRNTRNIWMVIKEGKVLDTKYDPNWVNPVPAPASTGGSPVAAIRKLTPAIVRQNSQSFTLTVEGPTSGARARQGGGVGGYGPNSVVRFDNVDLPTTYAGGNKVTATVDARLLQRGPGLYPVYIVNQGLRGNVSPAAYLVIDSDSQPVRVIPQDYEVYGGAKAYYGQTGVNERGRFFGPYPRAANQGSGKNVPLTIRGTRFAPDAVVMLDNVALPTKVISDTEVTATVDAKFLERAPGSYVMYVLNPGAYGNITEAGYFLVALKDAAPQPALP